MKHIGDIAPAAVTLVFGVAVITPLCGLLFGCGCAWPGAGFYFGCNFFVPNAEHRCPWCVAPLAAVLPVALAVIAAFGASLRHARAERQPLLRLVLIGASVFMVAGFLSAWLAGAALHYPEGLVGSEGSRHPAHGI